jgi:N-acetyl-gamma-glutamyl-phosphate reductase
VLRAGIINVTGYVGAELARLLAGHPNVEVTSVTGRSQAGKRLPEVFPHLWSLDLPIDEEVAPDVDVVISALPHAAAAKALAPHVAAGTPVIDCSADFRLHDPSTYEQWYGEHPQPALLPNATYGLPELHRDAISESRLVAVPGCYPTSAILGLAPLAAAGWLESAIVDAKSGVSGAGRALKLTSHFSEVDENLSAYGLSGQRHQPEMVQELGELTPDDHEVGVTFVPHLIPMVRGILATSYATLSSGSLPANSDDAREILVDQYRAFYADHPFVHVSDTPPSTKQTMGSNACLIYPSVDNQTGQVTVISCIDNLVKGAAGGAVQCLNVMQGFDEQAGLTSIGLYP